MISKVMEIKNIGYTSKCNEDSKRLKKTVN